MGCYKQLTVSITNYGDDTLSGVSRHEYDVNGHLRTVRDLEGERKLSYVSDHDGRILQRREQGASKAGEYLHFHNYYYFNGLGIGDYGEGVPGSHDYAESLAEARDAFVSAQAGLERNAEEKHFQTQSKQMAHERDRAMVTPVTSADFDANFAAITASSAPSSYTVQRTGEDLKDIARVVYGDSSLWYVIADANALSPDVQLSAGQVLTIPQSINNIHHTSETFKPFDPSETIGNVAPTVQDAPAPKATGLAQAIVSIVAIIVAVIVTVITAGAGSVLLQAVLVAVASNVAGQLAAMALDLQEDFDWGAVGKAAVTAFITAGIGNIGFQTQGTWTNAITNGMAKQALTEAATAAIDDDKSFSWSNIGKAAVVGGVMAGVGKAINGNTPRDSGTDAGSQGQQFSWSQEVYNFAGVAAEAAVQRRVEEAVFQDEEHEFDWGNVAADAIGGTLRSKLMSALPQMEEDNLLFGEREEYDYSLQRGFSNIFRGAVDTAGGWFSDEQPQREQERVFTERTARAEAVEADNTHEKVVSAEKAALLSEGAKITWNQGDVVIDELSPDATKSQTFADADYDGNGRVSFAEQERYSVENPTETELASIARRDANWDRQNDITPPAELARREREWTAVNELRSKVLDQYIERESFALNIEETQRFGTDDDIGAFGEFITDSLNAAGFNINTKIEGNKILLEAHNGYDRLSEQYLASTLNILDPSNYAIDTTLDQGIDAVLRGEVLSNNGTELLDIAGFSDEDVFALSQMDQQMRRVAVADRLLEKQAFVQGALADTRDIVLTGNIGPTYQQRPEAVELMMLDSFKQLGDIGAVGANNAPAQNLVFNERGEPLLADASNDPAILLSAASANDPRLFEAKSQPEDQIETTAGWFNDELLENELSALYSSSSLSYEALDFSFGGPVDWTIDLANTDNLLWLDSLGASWDALVSDPVGEITETYLAFNNLVADVGSAIAKQVVQPVAQVADMALAIRGLIQPDFEASDYFVSEVGDIARSGGGFSDALPAGLSSSTLGSVGLGSYSAGINLQERHYLDALVDVAGVGLNFIGAQGVSTAVRRFDWDVVRLGETEIAPNKIDNISTTELESVLGQRYAGIKEASQFLQYAGVPRDIRKQVLESFDIKTLNLRQATDSEFGIRYFDNVNAWEKGRYLFETFPASRQNLALKPEWNQMTYMKQFQIRPNTTILEGRASSMGVGVEGSQIQKYILDLNDLLEP